MKEQIVLTEKKGHIGIITLNRPENLNTFSTAFATELNEALLQLDEDPETRVVVIRGNGKAFCAGIDISELEGQSPLELVQWTERMNRMSLIIAKMKKPVIASVHDVAMANGLGIVASADLAVAAEGARFGTTAVNVGLFCMGPAVPLSRHVGKKKALEMLLTGKIISAAEAERIGLLNRVVPLEQLEEATMELASTIAAKSPLAVQLGKQSYYKMVDLDYQSATELVTHHFASLAATEDALAGTRAFLNKRKPEWKEK